MAKGQDLSRHQQGIVRRYYDHKDTITAARLGEIVSDLSLLGGDHGDAGAARKAAALWKRAATALKQTTLAESSWQAIVEKRDVKGLAELAGRLAV